MPSCTNPECPVPPTKQFLVPRKDSKTGFRGRCRECWSSQKKEYAKRNPPKENATYLRKRRYGVTPEMYSKMQSEQDGKCALCGVSGKLHIDHNHSTGAVRALLCGPCNRGLGMFKEDQELLIKAIHYLEIYNASPII